MQRAGSINASGKVAEKIPQVLAAFAAGLLLMFTGCLLYSKLHQHSLPAEATVAAAQTNVSSAQPADVGPARPEPPPPSSPTAEPGSTHVIAEAPVTSPSASLRVPVPPRGESPEPAPNSAIATNHPSYPPVQTPPVQTAPSARFVPPPSPQPATVSKAQAPPEPARQVVPTPHAVPVQDVKNQQNVATPSREDAAKSESTSNTVSAKPEVKVLTIPAGTVMQVRLAQSLSSDRNRTGDVFRAALASPVVVDGIVVTAADTAVLGRIAEAHRAPIVGGRSKLTLALTNITGSNGALIPVSSSYFEEQGAGSGLLNTAKMATGAAVGATIGALTGAAEGAGISSALRDRDRTDGFMATKRTVVLPEGALITFRLGEAISITR